MADLPTLDDMIKNNPTKEEKKAEPEIGTSVPVANEEEKKEEEKQPEDTKAEPKKEDIKIEEEKQKKEKPIEPPKPKEPEPKIPTDFKGKIDEITKIKMEGNSLFKTDLNTAQTKYQEAYEKLNEIMPQVYREKDYNKEQCEQLIKLNSQVMSNLAICLYKNEKYNECIDIDTKLISLDKNADKSYSRLFYSYKKLGKPDRAVYFGKILTRFDDATKSKYTDAIKDIDTLDKELTAQYNEMKAKRRKEKAKGTIKYIVPVIVLLIGFFIYYKFVRKTKK